MTGHHESRLRAAVVGVRDADVLTEMAVGWRTALSEIKVAEQDLARVRGGLEDREQLGRETREAAVASLTEMSDHLREQRRVLRDTARALDDAGSAMGRAVRLVESWDRAGVPVAPGPAPQPDPGAKPGDDQSAYLAALGAHATSVTAYQGAVAQREEAAKREMDHLEQVFAHAEEEIRVRHGFPTTRLTEEQHRLEDERRRLLEEERHRLWLEERERQRLLEEERQREEEERRRRDEERQREEEERRRREEEQQRDRDRSRRPPPEVPGRIDTPSLSGASHAATSDLEGSGGPLLVTTVSAEAQGGVTLADPAGPAAAPTSAAAPASAAGAGPLVPGPVAGTSPTTGGFGSAPSTGTSPSAGAARVGGSAPAVPVSPATAGGAGGRGIGGAVVAGHSGGSGGRGSGAGSTRRGRRTDREATSRPRGLRATDSDWFEDDEGTPGVLG